VTPLVAILAPAVALLLVAGLARSERSDFWADGFRWGLAFAGAWLLIWLGVLLIVGVVRP